MIIDSYISDVTETLNDSGSPCWELCKRHGGTAKEGYNYFINTSQDTVVQAGDDDTPNSLRHYLAASIEYLDKCIRRLPGGAYKLKIYTSFKNKGKHVQVFDFDVPKSSEQFQNQRIGNAPNPSPQVNVEALVAKEVQVALDRMELEKLRAENKELMQMVEDPTGWKVHASEAIGKINEYAPHFWGSIANSLLNRFAPQPLGKVAGAQPVPFPGKAMNGPSTGSGTDNYEETIIEDNEEFMTPEEMTPEQREIMAIYDNNSDAFGEVLFRLINHDHDLLTTLQKLADKLDSGKLNIEMIKGFL